MGVITVTDVDYGHIFGPFPTHVSPADPAYLIGMLTNDKRPEGFMLKMDPSLRKEGLRVVDWLPYIQPARDSEEQNMEAYLKEGQVYFRALRIIKAGEEMLVWYSKDFAQLLNIPELPRHNDREHYICPRCGDTFEYPYPLRAHIKFKCSFVLQNFSPNKAFLPQADFKNALICSNGDRAFRSFRPFNPRPCTDTGRNASPKDIQLNGLDFSRAAMQGVGVSHSLVGLDFSKSRNNNGVDYSKSTNEHSPVSVDISYQADSIRAAHSSPSSTLASPASSSSAKSERSSSVDLSPPAGKLHSKAEFAQSFKLFAESRKRGMSPPLSPRKGSPGGDRSPASSPKIPRLQGEPRTELLSPGKVTTAATADRSPGRSPSSLKDGPGEVTSAFRKVERTSTPETERPSSGGSSIRAEDNASLSPVDGNRGPVTAAAAAVALPHTLHVPPLSRFALPVAPPTSSSSAAVHGLPSAMPGPLMSLYMPRLPVGPPPSPLGLPGVGVGVTAGPLHAVSAHHPAFAAADQIPPGLLEMCRAAIPSIGPLTESFANIRNGEGPGIQLKPGLFLGERGGGHPSMSGVGGLGPAAVPFLKTNNPMVEKILQSTSPALMASSLSPIGMSQNWCAKCNATFRMTSDLVYHMRSHHKREFDPMKRKREEKLKCTICNEMFRERHHLTRHMSSHA